MKRRILLVLGLMLTVVAYAKADKIEKDLVIDLPRYESPAPEPPVCRCTCPGVSGGGTTEPFEPIEPQTPATDDGWYLPVPIAWLYHDDGGGYYGGWSSTPTEPTPPVEPVGPSPPVPESAAFLLMAVGLVVLALWPF